MPHYRFENNLTCEPSDPGWPDILRNAYAGKIRPLCLCKAAEPPAMYIAATKTGHTLKRMPNTGPQHGPQCDHYEAPPEVSGLGQVAGSAIREDPDSGVTTIAVDFALSKGAPRAPADSDAVEHSSVRADGKKLTLRGTLHYLLDQAHLTRWVPAMAGKRSWNVVRRELISAAADTVAKGQALNELLFIPEEVYRESERAAANERRAAKLARMNGSPGSRMILIGELVNIVDGRYGERMLQLKNLPDIVSTSEDLCQRLRKHFGAQLAMDRAKAVDGAHLLLIGTISQPLQGLYNLEEASLLNVNAGYLPFETMNEYALLEALVGRRFTKTLRYNLSSKIPVAFAILHDTPRPTALYVVPPGSADEYSQAVSALAASVSSRLDSWIWGARDATMPALPAPGYPQLPSNASPSTPPLTTASRPTSDDAIDDLAHANALAQEAASDSAFGTADFDVEDLQR